MRVAHLLRKYDPAEWGGTESAVLRLLEGLKKCGVDSVVFAPRLGHGVKSDPFAEAGFRVRRFEAIVPIWGLSREAREQMIAMGGNIVSFELLRALGREPDLDVIHSHALGRLGGIGLTIARRRGLPFVTTIHGGVYDVPPAVHRELSAPVGGWEWGKVFGLFVRSRQMLHEADAILTCNPREGALMRENHPDRRVRVQPHGVDADVYAVDHRVAASAAFSWTRGAKVILIVSRLSSVKNPAWVVERMPEILAQEPGAVLAIAGACTENGYREALERRIDELKLRGRVHLLGGLPARDPRLIGLMQLARTMVLPSQAEPFGLVILEAWAAGTPMLASRTSGAESLIRSGESGVLFELDRPLAFNAAVLRVLQDDAWRASLAEAGRRRVREHHDATAIAAQVKAVYDELVAERNPLQCSA